MPSDELVVPKSADVSPGLPSFLKPTKKLDLRPALLSGILQGISNVLAIPVPQTRGGRLAHPFFLEQQRQSNWCWASVGVALNRFFQRAPLTQCQLVQRTRRPAGVNCCSVPGDPQCDVTENMSNVFATVGLNRRAAPAQPQGALAFIEIQADISRDCPIVCAMLGGGSAHFVVMVGWALIDGVEFVTVDDPAVGGRVQRSLRSFTSGFNGRQWAQSTRLAQGPN